MRTLTVALCTLALCGCSSTPPPAEAPAATGLIAETTKSPEALEHFHTGERLFYNIRQAEAAKEFEQALALDPDFVLAHAYHAQAVLGDAGLREADDAAKAAGSLPEAERLLVQSMAAGTRGDVAEAETLLGQLTKAAPNDWRSHYALGVQLLNSQKYDQAIPSLKRATELNAAGATAHNMLGYALLRQRDSAGAITAFEEYARLLPEEPNPQDSLGEALVAAGRFDEATAAFNKALTLSPQFWNAHQGIAYAKIYAGDWAAGRKALEDAQANAALPAEKVSAATELAAAVAASGKTQEALQIVEAAQKTPGAEPGTLAFLPLQRAQVLIMGGQPRQALAALAPALTAADDQSLPPGLARRLRTQALRVRVTAESQLGDAAAATATAGLLQQEASARPGDPATQDAMHYANGMAAMATRDFAAARMAFMQCSADDEFCEWQRILATERAGDAKTAATDRDRLVNAYRRDPGYLMVRASLTKKK